MFNPLRGVVLATVCGSITPNIGGSITAVSDSRRLLLGLDCADCDTIAMTHESLASMLNVRREGISKAANHLQREGLISYRRGHITVIDREGLEERAGECYASQFGSL